MKTRLFLSLVLSLCLASCAVTRPVGTGIQKAADKVLTVSITPAAAVAKSNTIKEPVATALFFLALVPAAGGLVVSTPMYVIGAALGGQHEYGW